MQFRNFFRCFQHLRFQKKKADFHQKMNFKHQKKMWIIQAGYLGLVFASCYLMIPLYKLYCQKVGTEGDMKQKDFEELKSKIHAVNKNRKIRVQFDSVVDPSLNWEFEPM